MASVHYPEAQLPGQDYDAYFHMAEGYARRRGIDPDTAKDIAQNACLKIIVRGGVPVPEDEGRYCPPAYVNTVTRHCIADVAQKGYNTPLPGEEEVLETVLEPTPSTEDEWMKGVVSEGLQDAMLGLSPAHREILLLSATGYNDHEIANQLGIAEATVRTRLHRARHNIKSLLDNRGDL